MNRKSDDAFALSEATLPAINRAFDEGRLTAEHLVRRCLDRIEAYDRQGPCINAVINLNPEALQRARELDRERGRSGPRGPLHGIPVVVKDTIDVAGMPTTGGFTALAESLPGARRGGDPPAARCRRGDAGQGRTPTTGSARRR